MEQYVYLKSAYSTVYFQINLLSFGTFPVNLGYVINESAERHIVSRKKGTKGKVHRIGLLITSSIYKDVLEISCICKIFNVLRNFFTYFFLCSESPFQIKFDSNI